jgi:hypothetical protein
VGAGGDVKLDGEPAGATLAVTPGRHRITLTTAAAVDR